MATAVYSVTARFQQQALTFSLFCLESKKPKSSTPNKTSKCSVYHFLVISHIAWKIGLHCLRLFPPLEKAFLWPFYRELLRGFKLHRSLDLVFCKKQQGRWT